MAGRFTWALCRVISRDHLLRTCPHYAEGIWKRRFHSPENASNVFNPHYAGGIWKRRFHSPENASNVFSPHYAGGILKRNNHRSFCICVSRKLGQGNHIIIVTSSISKSYSNFEKYSNFSGLKSVFEKFRFGDGLLWRLGLTVEKKMRCQIFSPYCGRCQSFSRSFMAHFSNRINLHMKDWVSFSTNFLFLPFLEALDAS